ncbi:MAG: hypothetical protein ABL864_14870 [Terricaulis sp.]
MPTWIVLIAALSIVVTGALTWVLWRLNQGAESDAATRRESASDFAASDTGAHAPKAANAQEDNSVSDAGSDGGGGGGD